MGIVDDAREMVDLVHDAKSKNLHQKILSLQGEILKLVEENQKHKNECRELKGILKAKKSVVFENNVYWFPKEGNQKKGPFCSACWDNQSKLIRLHSCSNPAFSTCPICKITAQIDPNFKPVRKVGGVRSKGLSWMDNY